MQKRITAALLIALIFLFAASCKEDPASPQKETPDIDWPSMTERDDVIRTVLLAYDNPRSAESMARYGDVLHSMYFFRLRATDVEPGGSPIITRAEDIQSTEWIFESHTMLLLEIPEAGAWDPAPEIEGEPCDNCWVTTRQYYVQAQFGDDTVIYQSAPDRAFVTVIAAPDEGDSSKWVIRAMFDLGM